MLLVCFLLHLGFLMQSTMLENDCFDFKLEVSCSNKSHIPNRKKNLYDLT